jgi:hypothetical protein
MNNIKDIANNIFYNNIKPECSIQFYLETDNNSIEDIFHMLLEMFTEGMKILFSEDNKTVDLSKITDYQFNIILNYFKSFGFIIYYNIIPDITDEYINNLIELPDLNEKKKKNLSDYFLRLNSNNINYRLSFDNYISNTKCN